jgi:ATP-dependent helicase/nuclease subunit A
MTKQPRLIVYSSSAGSGKTYTLAKEYLKLALLAPLADYEEKAVTSYFRHILAVTFTNEAAKEMKERIFKQLRNILLFNKDGQVLLEQLAQEITKTYPKFLKKLPEATEQAVIESLRLRAGFLYQYLLHHYTDISISTIDSFFNRITQSFAKDWDLPFDYEIQLDTEETLEKATFQLIESVGEVRITGKENAELKQKKEDKLYLTNLVTEFIQKQLDDDKDWNIEKEFEKFGGNLFKEDKIALLNTVKDLTPSDFKEIKQQLQSYINNFVQKLQTIGKNALELIEKAGLTPEDIYRGKSGIYNYFKKVKNENPKDLIQVVTDNHAGAYVLAFVHDDKHTSSKDAATIAAVEGIAKDLKAMFSEIEKEKEEKLPNVLIALSALENFYQLATISELSKKVHAILTEKNAVYLADCSLKINEIVENSPVPYIYERLGEKYHHILIDEFQDTSITQWHNLIPLVANSLDKDATNLIVGDVKQAIYRWRGGEAASLANLPQISSAQAGSFIQEYEEVFGRLFQKENLQRNYRSLQNIVAFNNLFFKELPTIFQAAANSFNQQITKEADYANYDNYLQIYNNYYQDVFQYDKGSEGGHVEINLLNQEDKVEYRQKTLAYIIQKIQYLVNKESYKYGDIAIITRKKDEGAWLAVQLTAAKMPVISDESLLLSNSPRVCVLINFLKLLVNPLNPSNHADLLYDLAHTLQITKTEDLDFQISEVANQKNLQTTAQFIATHFNRQFDFIQLQYLSLYEIAEEIIRTLEFQENAEEINQIYLQKFLDILLDFGLKNGNSLIDFLEYWEVQATKVSINSPKSGNAVRLLTIHKSKGLEFPIVFFPFVDWSLAPYKVTHWCNWQNEIAPKLPIVIINHSQSMEAMGEKMALRYQNEEQFCFIDNLNLLYVAFTRAKEKLYLSCKGLTKKEEKNSTKFPRIRRCNELLSAFANFSPQAPKEIIESEEEKIFVFFEDIAGKDSKQEAEKEQRYVFQELLSTECREKIRMRRSDTQKFENQLHITNLYDLQEKGNIIHRVFEKLIYRHELPTALQKLLNEGWVTEKELPEIRQKVEDVLALPTIAQFYEPQAQRKILNEREIIVRPEHYSDFGKSLRPDRVVIEPDETVVIIDYKTGEKSDSHRQQIQRYGEFYHKMGYSKVRKLLVYTQLLEVEEV